MSPFLATITQVGGNLVLITPVGGLHPEHPIVLPPGEPPHPAHPIAPTPGHPIELPPVPPGGPKPPVTIPPPPEGKPPEANAPTGYEWVQAFIPMPAQGWSWVLDPLAPPSSGDKPQVNPLPGQRR